jgi:hypothetical protein
VRRTCLTESASNQKKVVNRKLETTCVFQPSVWQITNTANKMASPARSRGRPRSYSRSPTPRSYHSRSPSLHRRSPSPAYRSPTPPRRNGRYESRTPSRSRSRSRSYSRDRDSRARSRTRSETPMPRSTKVGRHTAFQPAFGCF